MNQNVAVFTSKYVLEEGFPIVNVFHDNDGDWQFLGSQNDLTEADARVVSLGEIVEMDASIADILWLPPGTSAWRTEVGAEWTTVVDSE